VPLSSSHESFEREEEVEGPSPRAFGFTFAVVFGLLALAPLVFAGRPRWWALAVALAFAAVARLRPALLAPLNRLWLRLGLLLHAIVSPVVLGIIFFLVLTPTAWLVRMLGKDLLRLAFDREAASYWIERHPRGPDRETMRQQF
jgi:hypothetical protein